MSQADAMDVDTHQNLRILEALLFAASEPLREKVLAERLPQGANLKSLLTALAERYEGRGIVLRQADGAWAFRTAADLAPLLNMEQVESRRLSRAGLETLSIIAYHQPVTRAEVEDIRGVALSKGTLDILLEAGWIKPRGRRNTPGRPLTWGTTEAFLDHFGLDSLKDLPGLDDLKAAGLLDARPALAAYGARANDDGSLVDMDDDDGNRRTGGDAQFDLLEEEES